MHFIAGMSRWGGIICSLLASLSLHAQQASLADAKAQIDQFWAKKVAPCANTLATHYVAGDFNVMKAGRWTVQPRPISQVDAMNGIQWQGTTQLIAEASRVWLPNQGWRSWEQGTGFGAFGVDVTKANGRWTFRPNPGSAIDNMIAPACSAVPREPTATERASALNAQMQGLCEMAKPGPRYSIGAVGIWVQQANDVNSCRDEQGRTLLMLHFLNSVYNSAGNQIELIRSGANLSVKDNQGWSALLYAVQAYHSAQASDHTGVMDSHRDRIREMVARGADPENMVDAQGNVLDQPIPNASGTQSNGDRCAAYERLKAEGKMPEESKPPKGCHKKGILDEQGQVVDVTSQDTATAGLSIVADPSSGVILRECSAPLAFVPLKTKSAARFNVTNGTTQILRLSMLDSRMHWIVQGEVPLPHGGLGVGTDYAEEIWRIEDSHGACLKIVGPRQAQWTNIAVEQH